MFDVCTTGDTAHFDMISKVVATHTCVLFISILFCAAWVAGSLAPFIGATFNSKDLPEFWNYFKFNISLIKLFPSHRRSLTSAILTCRKVRRRSNFLRMSEFGLHIVKYMCIYMYIQGTPVQYSATWWDTVWASRRPCYYPALFFHRLRLIALSYMQEKIRRISKILFYF